MVLSPSSTPSPAKKIIKRSLLNARTRRTLDIQISGQARKGRLISIAQRFKGIFQNQAVQSLYLEISFFNAFDDFNCSDPIYFNTERNAEELPIAVLHPDGKESKTKHEWKRILRDMSTQAIKAREFVEKQLIIWQSKDWSHFLEPCLGLEKFEHFNLLEFVPIVISHEYLAQAPASPEI